MSQSQRDKEKRALEKKAAKRAERKAAEKKAEKKSTEKKASSTAVLADRSTNSRVQVKDKGRKSGKAPATATSMQAAPITLQLSGHRFDVRFKARHIYFANVKEVLKLEEAREKRFLQSSRHRTLITSFMAGKDKTPATGAGGENPPVEEFEMDFMNILNIPAFGNFSRMWIEMYFGKGPRSAPIELVVDTGSAAIWVNETDYNAAVKKTKSKEGKYQSGRTMSLRYSAGDVIGQVYKDTVSFFPPNAADKDKVYVKNQLFGVVDEKASSEAKRWKDDLDVRGIFGIGPRAVGEGVIQSNESGVVELPTVVDNMKDQKLISAHVIGIYFKLPDEGKRRPSDNSSVDSGSDAGTINGALHFGAPRKSVFNVPSLREVIATRKGESGYFYGIDLKLSYNGVTIMNNSPGIIDTGSHFISLPEAVLYNYLLAIQNASGRPANQPVVTYDESRKLYCMAKADFGLLKELEFDFVMGYDAVFRFSPSQQVSPPMLTKHWATSARREELFLPFKKLTTAHEGRQFILGMKWVMWYYLILDSSGTDKKIGIANIDGQTDYVWQGLS